MTKRSKAAWEDLSDEDLRLQFRIRGISPGDVACFVRWRDQEYWQTNYIDLILADAS